MKKLLTTVFALGLSLAGFSQNVTIPDANFKQALIDAGVDTNDDKEIQLSEAEIVDTLDIRYKDIQDLSGINAFKNLIELDCVGNELTELNLDSLQSLKRLYCYENYDLNALDVTKSKSLEVLYCYGISLQSLKVSGLSKLRVLEFSSNQVGEIDLEGLVSLEDLQCSDNDISDLDVSELTKLKEFECDGNQLTSLDVSTMSLLDEFDCSNNALLAYVCISSGQVISDLTKDAHTEFREDCVDGKITSTEVEMITEKEIVSVYNVLGSEVPTDTKGQLLILEYSDGSREKVYVAE